jgi:hypothetical protein
MKFKEQAGQINEFQSHQNSDPGIWDGLLGHNQELIKLITAEPGSFHFFEVSSTPILGSGTSWKQLANIPRKLDKEDFISLRQNRLDQ